MPPPCTTPQPAGDSDDKMDKPYTQYAGIEVLIEVTRAASCKRSMRRKQSTRTRVKHSNRQGKARNASNMRVSKAVGRRDAIGRHARDGYAAKHV